LIAAGRCRPFLKTRSRFDRRLTSPEEPRKASAMSGTRPPKNIKVKAMAARTTAAKVTRGGPSVSGAARAGNVLTRLLAKGRPLVMGVLNVTPDSFSDGGRFLEPAAALAQARRLVDEGADIIDVGAESTRPYGEATPVSLDEERHRLTAVLPALIGLGAPVSIDTMKAPVAAWALETGAAIVNDVWGLQRDPDMARVIANYGAPVIVMHNRDKADPTIDIIAAVTEFFSRSLEIAWQAGITREQIVLDPGIGFGKTPEQSLACIARLDAWRGFDLPILVGASRKRFINTIAPAEPSERLGGSLAAHLTAIENGATIIRAHDVAPTVQALAVTAAIRRAR
jgi:dihydropteroate synthase